MEPTRIHRRMASLWHDAPLGRKGAVVVATPLAALLFCLSVVIVVHLQSERATVIAVRAQQIDLAKDVVGRIADGLLRDAGAHLMAGPATPSTSNLDLRDQFGPAVAQLVHDMQQLHEPVTIALVPQVNAAAAAALVGFDSMTGASPAQSIDDIRISFDTVSALNETLYLVSDRVDTIKQESTGRTKHLMAQLTLWLIATVSLGAVGATWSIRVFARGIVRRIRLVEGNAHALGTGQPLTPLKHSRDELGRLGAGLDQADQLLRERGEALSQTRSTLEHLLATGPLIAFQVDATRGTISYLNSGVEILFGWNAGDLMGEPLERIVDPIDHDTLLIRCASVAVGGTDTPADVGFVTADGTVRRCSLSLRPDLQSAVPQIFGYAFDVETERKATAALRASEERLAHALEVAKMGTWDLDPATGRVISSTLAITNLGADPESFPGTFDAFLACVHPDDRAALLEPPAEDGRSSTEFRAVALDGSIRWVEGNSVMQFEDGALTRIVGTSTDITARKAAEAELQAARDEAVRANGAKSDFLSRVSHELRTPLNSILGFGQLLELEDLTESQHECVAHVLQGGRHLLALVDDVLDISRIEAGTLALSLEPVALADVLGEVQALMRPIAAEAGIKLGSPSTAPGGVHVWTDRRRLKQVLLNLISNAIKYNRPGGSVDLAWRAEDGKVRLDVIDSGIGISPEQMTRIFTPFDRLNAERTTVPGTGIGLALTKRLVESLDGALLVDSEPGRGSTFSVFVAVASDPVPAQECTPQPCTSETESNTEDGRERLTVLYIEDNPSNLMLIERMMQRWPGVRLLTATTGEDGLHLAASVPLNLVLLDLHLPGLSGEDVLRRLQRSPATAAIPVVILSADATPTQIERLLQLGAHDYLTKPLDLARLGETLDGIVSGACVR